MRRIPVVAILAVFLSVSAFAEDPITSLEAKSFEIPDSHGLRMIRIESGTFMMGSPEDEVGRGPDEPQHKVTITRPFYMAETEVTQEQYLPIAVPDYEPIYIQAAAYGHSMPELHQDGPWMTDSKYYPSTDKFPMDAVVWEKAMEFCARLTEREKAAGRIPEGYVYRLPTEAEWEYACRAGSTGPFSNDGPLHKFSMINTGVRFASQEVKGEREPNAWGLYGMHGGRYEWCLDWYGPLSEEPATDPIGPATGTRKVARGGDFASVSPPDVEVDPAVERRYIRCAARNHFIPDFQLSIVGFRVVLGPKIEN